MTNESNTPPIEFYCPECKNRWKGNAAMPCQRCGNSGIMGYNGKTYVPM